MPQKPHYIEPRWPAPAGVFALSSTRLSGTSSGPYEGLNLGDHVGDSATAVQANRRQLQDDLPSGTQLHWLQQVHGSRVAALGSWVESLQADASWTREPGRACVVMTADCLPVLFCSMQGDVVAASHAGWRGLVDGVLEATVEAMGCAPGQILAWLGPAIGPAAYEVGSEVRDQCLAPLPHAERARAQAAFSPGDRSGHYYADLYKLATQRLKMAGVSAIYGGNYCTFSDPGQFYSHRRDGITGRMASLIVIKSCHDTP